MKLSYILLDEYDLWKGNTAILDPNILLPMVPPLTSSLD